MANKAKIGASIVLDGEKKYKEAVTGCNNKLKELRAELGLVKEKYAENANSSEALEEKAKALNAILKEQKNKEAKTKEAREHAIQSCNNLKASVQKLKNEYEQEKKKLEEIAKASGTSTKEYDNQKKVVEELEKAHQKGQNTLQKAENRVNTWTTKLKTAETQTIRAGRAVKQNEKYLQEAENSTDGCSKSLDEYGKKVKKVVAETSTLKDSFKANMASTAAINSMKMLGNSIKDIGSSAISAAKSAALYADDINTLATQTGVSTDSLQELKYMEDLVDVSLETVTGSMAKNIKRMAMETYEIVKKYIGM